MLLMMLRVRMMRAMVRAGVMMMGICWTDFLLFPFARTFSFFRGRVKFVWNFSSASKWFEYQVLLLDVKALLKLVVEDPQHVPIK